MMDRLNHFNLVWLALALALVAAGAAGGGISAAVILIRQRGRT